LLDDNERDELASKRFRLCPYERPTLEVIEIELEGSFLSASTSSKEFVDRVIIDDQEEAESYD
ncbi:MAG: hypothetical protein K2N16_09850, partial [Muribaculaceae bacterium]|nr:hypothetical protein [Muribaculaceae bacterium]